LKNARRGSSSVQALFLSFFLACTLGVTVSASQTPSAEAQDVSSTPTTLTAEERVALSKTVSLTVDGVTRKVLSTSPTVGALLVENKVYLQKLDRSSRPLTTPLTDNLEFTVTRIRAEMVTERIPLPFSTKETYTSGLPVGKKVVKKAGSKGERVKYFRDVYKNNKRVSHVKLKETATAPQSQHVVIGTRGMTLASRGYFSGRRIVSMLATGYGPGASDNGKWAGRTASGLKPGFGVVAVDPRFIPLGTRLYIDGYGYAVAGDTGGAIKGNRIDLGFDSHSEATRVGSRRIVEQ